MLFPKVVSGLMGLRFSSQLTFYGVIPFLLLFLTCTRPPQGVRILVFSKTAGFHHESIPSGIKAIRALGKENGFLVDTTIRAETFKEENLKKYAAVVFLNTTGDVLNNSQQVAFERFIQAGGGFVGIHSATDTEYGWPWYGKLVGAYFENHPKQQKAAIQVVDKENAATSYLPPVWNHFDEWYNFKKASLNPGIKVLLNLDEKSYEGGKMGDKHPVSWYHNYDGGRAFYTAMGHTDSSYSQPNFVKHILAGIRFAIGSNHLDYGKAYAQIPPDENRFMRYVLDQNLDEPSELAVAPDGSVFYVHRKGTIKLYTPWDKKTRQIAKLDVWTKAEDGLLSITLDPNFSKNHWLYLFYSPNGTASKQNISRFTFENDTIHSERVLLEIPTQRQECCHSGATLTFDSKGNLYASLGDNTNPFQSDGYSPQDERPERSAWDAQKSAANTNDLRGKILRIHPEPDGSYTIPDGNLFPKDGNAGRPEIYVMGCRNPYRITVDDETGYVYWGDVGPDAGKDSIQGPRGYDEINQARKAGNFGWPYFIADNKPYKKRNFETNQLGAAFNPLKPENTSPNNTGQRFLPPAQKAFIWYPYMESTEFPLLEKGGRCAMAGFVYHYKPWLPSLVKLPKYYDNALIAYDWMRNWFLAVRMDEQGNYRSMERMFTSLPLNRVIDMAQAPDGSIYMLEYGSAWFAQNEDARLIRVEYSDDNRAPVAKSDADVKVGPIPLKVNFSSKGSFDYDDNDSLTYEWRASSPSVVDSRLPNPSLVFTKPGIYNVILVVTDKSGNSSTSEVLIKAGNARPLVSIESPDNTSFFWDNAPFRYKASVTDLEDGSSEKGQIDKSVLRVSMNYLAQGHDVTIAAQGHQANPGESASIGATLIANSDCKACHQSEKISVGPAYKEIAKRYSSKPSEYERLAKKIITGGAGVWGDHGMSAHPQLKITDTREMVKYILSLADTKSNDKLINTVGNLVLRDHVGKGEEGSYHLIASYSDRGGEKVGSLTGQAQIVLRHPKVQAESYDSLIDCKRKSTDGNAPFFIQFNRPGSAFRIKGVSLTNVKSLLAHYTSEVDAGTLELHTDRVDGPLFASIPLKNTGKWNVMDYTPTNKVNPIQGKHDIFFVLKNETVIEKKLYLGLDWIYFGNTLSCPASLIGNK